MNKLKDDIVSSVNSYENCIGFNIIQAFSLIFHEERHSNKFDACAIDDLVRTIIETSEWRGPEDEPYPSYDKKRIDPMIEKIRVALGKPAKTPF